MLYGVTIFPTEYSIRPDDLGAPLGGPRLRVSVRRRSTRTSRPAAHALARAAPTCRRSTGTPIDPFVALTAAAVTTRDLKLGTGICLVVERDPIVTAKEVASLDFISNGRFIFGIGGGWNVEEMENHGTAFKTRWRLLRERVLAMKEIWSRDEAEFHGRYVDFDPIWSYPKPVQKPHPPILMGGDGADHLRPRDRVLRRLDADRSEAVAAPAASSTSWTTCGSARRPPAATPAPSPSASSAPPRTPTPYGATPTPASSASSSACPRPAARPLSRSWTAWRDS